MKDKPIKHFSYLGLANEQIAGGVGIAMRQRKSTSWPPETTDFAPIGQTELAILTSIFKSDVKNIQKIICELKEEIKNLQGRETIYETSLYDLGNKKYKLRNPINIIIEVYEDEFIAKFPELEIFGSGNTETMAILDLKNEIIILYDELVNYSEKELGRLPQMWRRILKKLVLCH